METWERERERSKVQEKRRRDEERLANLVMDAGDLIRVDDVNLYRSAQDLDFCGKCGTWL